MAAFVYFTVADTYQAIVSDGSDDGNEPDLKMISGTVTFTPSVKEVLATISDIPTTVRLGPIIGRIEEDGVLKTLDSTPGVKLLANTEAIGPLPELTYRVDFTNVVYNRKTNQRIEPFRFAAATSAVTLRLSSVERLPL
ncbi:Uncharacterised protein [Mycobacteroides abscessus subsp. abscessus]|uniref:Uncharacterized protein n=1 Tax=Mycobacteroides abscessus TaxID=36809 RepID=A0AB33T3U4_9MYCO|nr:hypothetical protein [Mycobacteroides abscessus]CPT12081.1 Hypothetical protein ERS075527_01156 [Mycobacteroides abscessus]CPT20671.1 Hypothetical protein ERS075531_01005 [Mycobacteroides abscessus]CPT25369.1 Hypothetical protein ERS075532_01355 [Mycobacteroides abscessus]CPU73572.1 Hypothetical protein ERS075567_00395 [Mycobacteroides abscessus]CPV25719.1 Hypothetical protein ERS075573_01007 [Mycobacteroides abscessus]